MKGSRKGHIPPKMEAWLNSANEDWQPAYPFDNTEVKEEVRSSLLAEQRGLCVYCGKRLSLVRPGETYHIEHFRPQTQYQALATDYSNLYLSCGQKNDQGAPSQTCGAEKANWFEEGQHVAPAYPGCTQRFRFMLNGSIETAIIGDAGAANMIKYLRLDHPELVKDRSDVLYLIDDGQLDTSDFWDAAEQSAQSYAHLVFQHLGETLP